MTLIRNPFQIMVLKDKTKHRMADEATCTKAWSSRHHTECDKVSDKFFTAFDHKDLRWVI